MHTLRNTSAFCLNLAFTLCALASTAMASTITYTYTGHDFSGLLDGGGPLTTSDFITASITFAAPLGDNLSNVSELGNALSWSISDGNTTINQSNASTNPSYGPGVFFVTTNASGNITAWEFEGEAGGCTATASCAQIYTVDSSGSSDDTSLFYSNVNTFTYGAANNAAPGVWTSATQAAAPEPSTLGLEILGGAALSLAGMWKRRNRTTE